MIPVFEKPYEDEHVLSWLLRVSKMNNIPMNVLIENYLPKFKWEHSVDTIGNLIALDCINPMQLLKENTLYLTMFPFLPEGTQAKILWRFLYGGDIHWYHTVTDLRFCPECIKEDIQNGKEPYYKVWHQLDEIHICAKHKTKLWKIPKKNVGVLNDAAVIASATPVEPIDYDVSSYIYELYKNPIYTSLEKWGPGMFYKGISRTNRVDAIKTGEKIRIQSVSNFKYLDNFNCKMCGKEFMSHPFSGRTTCICPSCWNGLSRQELVDYKAGEKGVYIIDRNHVKHKCGRNLSGGFHDFIWSDKECPCLKLPTLEDYKKEFDDEEFSIEGFETKKGKTTFLVRHHICGDAFYVGRTDFMNRRYCRCCAKSYAKVFEEKFYRMVGNEYTLVKLPVSSDKWFEAIHNICGEQFRMRARNFLEGQRCSFCQKNFGFEKTVELLNEYADLTGYTIEDRSPDIQVTLPDGTVKRMRFAVVIQELTRLDEPEYFVRKKRLEPIISEKAKVYLYIKENCNEEGIFVSLKDYQKLNMSVGNFFSSISYLKKSGHLMQLSKGIYQVVNRRIKE